MNLDIYNELDKGGVVLSSEKAIELLKDMINTIEHEPYIDYDEETVKDIKEDIELIEKNGWEWVLIEQCPMAISNINVHNMVKE